MSTLNWKVFSLKYDQKETSAFEDLSYLLFCAELENRIGLFRYKNQAGIETEPIAKGGIEYGFQSKYYTTSISDNKADIIDSIKKAQRENTTIDKLLFYINQEFSESTKVGQKKPKYQVDIENEAKKVNIEIIWRVPSHYELQLALPENKYIHDLFFCLDSNSGDLLEDLKKHTENILQSIQTEIIFNNQSIKINRSDVIQQIKKSLDDNHHLIISGEGGCGKTAVIKYFYYEFPETPICIFKATELNVSNINDLLKLKHSFTFEQFIESYQSEPKKLFIIDSAEKLAELNNLDILQNLINALKAGNWTIVFTTRHCYLDDLQFHIKQTHHLPCEVTNMSHLADEKLNELSNVFCFNLPDNMKFKDRIKNLFYLNEYINEYSNIDRNGILKNFVDLIWKKRIQNISYQIDNIHIEREKCFIQIAKDRCKTGLFYINAGQLSPQALFRLKQDDILGYNDVHDGYFITHDIYEEWALDKIINRSFANYVDAKSFFYEIDESLPMRRAFRIWLSEQISDNIDNINEFIKVSFTDNNISQFWKDELIVSVLLSDYSDTFFEQFEKEIIADNFNVLDRILFLLRIACKEIDGAKNIDLTDFLFTRPKGKGWESAIEFMYKFRDKYFENHLKLVLPLITDWGNSNKNGKTNRLAGLLALSLIEKKATTNDFYIERDAELEILKVIYNAALEIKDELKEIFDKVIENKWVDHNDAYESLCSKILEEPYYAVDVIKVLPVSVLQLCDLFWQNRYAEDDIYHRIDMEERYGLTNEYQLDYFPSSALQTPMYWLLQCSFKETLEFIIDFTNKSVECYQKSDYGKNDVKEVVLYIEDKEIKQYLSWSLWGMYRGIGSPVTPNLLQSIHMALEKILLEYASILDSKITEHILLMLLAKSKSASLSAIVCSIVLAYPNKFYNVALCLFRSIELFHIDSIRSMNEFSAKSLYSFGFLPHKQSYTNERLKTCEDKHRNSNLESLLVNYQFNGISGATDDENTQFINSIYLIIDQHKIANQTRSKEEQITFGILLARMDRRNMHPTVKKQDDSNYIIELNPELTEELKEHSTQATKEYSNFFKYTAVKMWSMLKCQEDAKAIGYTQYETAPLTALAEAKEILTGLKNQTIKLAPTDEFVPSFVCTALIRFYHTELSSEDLFFCKEIVVKRICDIFFDNYDYQISDGVEFAIHCIPQLMQLFPNEIPEYKRILTYALFDVSKIGEYKRICDYVIETIHQENLWKMAFNDSKSLLYAYITIKPQYNKYFKEEDPHPNYQFGQRRISKQNVLEKVKDEIKDIEFNNISVSLSDLDSFSIDDIEIIFLLIPNDTQEHALTSVVKQILPRISSLLIAQNRNKQYHLPLLRHHVFKKYAQFVLFRNLTEIEEYLKPFLDKLSGSEETERFIGAFVAAEWDFKQYDQFWAIWKILYNPIIEQKITGFQSDEIIIDYMLAWQWWDDGMIEWHSLKAQNLSFYEDIAKDLGNNPVVLYSISKVLNSIGSHFVDDGISWIYTVVSQNRDLLMKELESNTIFYLEQLMRKFIFINKEKIRREIRLKKQIVPILEFMIDRGSVHGYLLRESVL